MNMALFTLEELEELRRADEELEADFRQTRDEIQESRQRDRQARLDRLDHKGRRIADQQRAYREANREKIADQQRAYREANREAYNKYQREYARQLRARRKAAGVTV
jgi:5-methylcytosine-specific restriction endonuclease McrBC GTP-binding regulatory subunit McrB